MSTETETFIPGESDLEIQSGGKSWRFANGKIVRGKEIIKTATIDGDEIEVNTGKYPDEMTTVTGRLRRVWVYAGTTKYGEAHQLEADIETINGMVFLKSNLLDTNGNLKLSSSALNFAWCLLQYPKDGLIRLETALGKPVILKNGDQGGCPTYVNAWRIEGPNHKATRIFRPKHEDGEVKVAMNDQWLNELEPEIRKHSAWAEREVKVEDGSHLSELCKECTALGWPTPEQAPVEWLELVAMSFEEPKPRAALSSYNDEDWGSVRLAVQEGQKTAPGMPPQFEAVLERLSPKAEDVKATEESPFGADKPKSASAFGSSKPDMFANEK